MRNVDETLLQAIFEKGLNAVSVHTVVLDPTGRPVDYIFDLVNPAFETLTGLRSSDVLGKSVLSVLPGSEAWWIERYGAVALTGEPAEFEAFSSEIGKWFRVTAFQHKPLGFTVSFIDITSRVEEHQRALNSEAKYRTYFELGAAKLVIDPATGAIWEANPKAAEFYGYSLEQLVAMGIDQINILTLEEIQREMELARTEKRHYFNFRHRRADGQIREVEVHSNKGLWNGKEALFSIIFDMTEVNLLRKRTLQNEKLATIGAMTASINHEFGNLLSVLSAQFQMVQFQATDDGPSRQLAQNIRTQFLRSQRLIDSIKRLSRAQEVTRQHCRLSQILGDVVELETPQCKERHIHVDFRPVDDDWVNVDVALTQQVFLNLFKNAVQALNNVASPRIEILMQSEETELVVRVGNNGEVIPPTVRPNLFTPFFTTKVRTDEPGSGLGLSFSASVMSSHGGLLFLEDGLQTVFQARFPRLHAQGRS